MYNQLRDVSFEAHRGEVLGLAGLDSSGRTETLESIFGIRTRKEGTITLDGKPCLNRNAGESIKNGFALLTEERRATGIFGVLNIRDNTVISSLDRHLKGGMFLSREVPAGGYPAAILTRCTPRPPLRRRKSVPCPAAISKRSSLAGGC